MPYAPRQLIAPEIALHHQNVIIYHTYRNDDLESGAWTYRFTTHPDDLDVTHHFDVRELSVWKADPFVALTARAAQKSWAADEDQHIRKLLIQAIESGEIISVASAP